MSAMLDRLLAALERHPGIHDWAVQQRRRHSVQLYLIGREIESVREVVVEEYEVEVFHDHPWPEPPPEPAGAGGSGLARGMASLTLVPADAPRLAKRLDEAVLMASLVHNPPYPLAGAPAAPYPDVPLADPRLHGGKEMQAAVSDFASELWRLVEREPHVRLSAAECFLTRTELVLRNSRGVAAEAETTHAMVELALLADSGADEAEHFRQIEARRLEDLRLAEEVAEAAQFARDTLEAQPPRTYTGPVVLSGDALVPLFAPLLFHASALAAYNRLSRLQLGESLCGEREVTGDRLTLRSNALLPYGLGSYRFDHDGVPGANVVLYEEGMLRARQATQRYAHYLSVPVTGEAANTQVRPGTAGDEELRAADGEGGPAGYEIVAFSAPEVDELTGDFGMEIRLGYELTPHGRRPIKGGSLSGNVFEALTGVRFSRAIRARGRYHGPRAARFASLRVAGS